MTSTNDSRRNISALSVGRWFDPFISCAIITGAFFALHKTAISDVQLTLVIMLLTTTYLFFSEFFRARWTFKERPKQTFAEIIDRTITKFLGVLVGILAIFFAIWLFPAYDNATKLQYLREAILPTLAFILPISFLVIFATEYVLGEKRDGTYQFGLLVRGKINDIHWRAFGDGFLEWLLRGFFLQINFYAAVWYIWNIRSKGIPDITSWDFPTFITQLDLAIFGAIVFAILPGYLFASRLINTELKKVDRTWFGWVINFSCYPPLNAAIFGAWVGYIPRGEIAEIYAGAPVWAYYTQSYPWLLFTVGAFIIFFALIHLWGEAAVGVRAANMSQRGIITTGLFRYTRHPIYVSKCFQWAFIYFPFLSVLGILSAIQSAILFLLVCAIYLGRALSEERLLATDPDYVRYALYMDEHSIFAPVGRLFPIMTFRWRRDYWLRNNLLQPTTSY